MREKMNRRLKTLALLFGLLFGLLLMVACGGGQTAAPETEVEPVPVATEAGDVSANVPAAEEVDLAAVQLILDAWQKP